MKVVLKSGEDCDNYICEEMLVFNIKGDRRGYEECYPLCDRPEDAIIKRSLISCSDIIYWMKVAYKAGKNGEEFIKIEEPLYN